MKSNYDPETGEQVVICSRKCAAHEVVENGRSIWKPRKWCQACRRARLK